MQYVVMMTSLPPMFVGRDAELDALERVLDGGVRLVTIVGPLGAGKTRLARELCVRRGAATCFVDLTDVFERDAFLRTIAARLGVGLTSGDPVEQLAGALEACDFDVVVLDNFEQIVGVASPIVAALVERPNVPQLVITTREALGLSAEVRIALGALPAQFAVQLFEARAQAVVPNFVVADDDRETVAALLDQLDNLPLVIELAAARAGVLPPAQLLQRLASRFTHVRETQPTRTPRQASLRGAIEWSWELLDEDERQALIRSSVFRGGFSLDAAEAVLGVPDPIATTQALVAKSLLRREASVRDRMDVRFHHYESIRAYAAERLEGDERATTINAHRAHFGALADRLAAPLRDGANGAAQADALARLDEELGNLLAVLSDGTDEAAAAGLAVDRLLEARGPAEMRRRVLTSFKTRGDDEMRRQLALAETELALGRIDAAQAWLHDAQTAGDHIECALTACRIARARGDLDAARRAAARAIELANTPRDEARARANLAAVTTDDLSVASAQCDAALRLLARHEDARLSVMVRNVAGTIAMTALDLDTAAAHFGRVLPDAAALGESRVEAAARSNLALVDHYRGQLDDAAAQFAAATTAFRRIGLRAESAMASGNRAAVLLELGRFEDAAAELVDAGQILGGRGGPAEGVVLATRANLHHVRGEPTAARDLYERAALLVPASSAHAASTAVYKALAAFELGDDTVAGALLDSVDHAATWRLAKAFTRGWRAGGLDDVISQLHADRHGLPRYVAAGFDALLSGESHRWLFVTLLRRLPRAVVDQPVVAATPAHSPDLRVDPNGYWFETADGTRVDIRRRGPARLLLLAMVERHRSTPGEAFDLDELFEVGWPDDQQIDIEAAYKRVYAAIGTLRRLGLEDLIVTTDDGYLIAPNTLVET